MKVTFDQLRPNQKIRHRNGTAYLIVRVVEGEPNLVYARWRIGPVGRFGKEVVQITPKHILGFRGYRARDIRYVPRADRAPKAPEDEVRQPEDA